MAKYELSTANEKMKAVFVGDFPTLKLAKQKAKELCPEVKFSMVHDWTYGATGFGLYLSESCDPFFKIERVQ